MVPKFFKLLNRDMTTMNQAALVLAVFSVLSQVFGLLRDRLLASLIGPSASLDVYYAAFRIPDFIFISVGALFSITVLIPFITNMTQESKESESQSTKKFFNSVFSVYCLGTAVVCLIVAVLMPYLAHLTAPGFSGVQHNELVLFSRIMLLSPFLMGLASLLGSFAQVQKKFLSFAIAPLFYNFGILVGVIFLRPLFGLKGVVFGVVFGALLFLLIQLPTLLSLQKFPTLTMKIDWSLIKKVMSLSVPRALGLSLNNVTFIIISSVASLLVAGSISIFQFSYNIETTPLIIIGISYAVAAFPTLTRLHIEGQKKEFLDMVHRATRNIFFLSIPAALFIIVLRAHVVRILLGAGAFSWNDTRLVAASLALFSISVTAQCMIFLLVRGFYAMSNTKTPLKINAWSVLVTVVSVIILLFSYKYVPSVTYFLDSLLRIEGTTGGSVIMLALAYSIGQIVNAIMLWRSFHRAVLETKAARFELNRSLWHIVQAGIIASAAVYGTLVALGSHVDQQHFWGIFSQAIIASFIGIAFYAIVLIALKNEDIAMFIDTAKSKFWKAKPLVIPQQDL